MHICGNDFSGFGLSVGMPVVLSSAGDVPGINPSDSIAIVTAVTYFGFLVGPPFFGYMGDVLGAIRWALFLCACIVCVVVVLPGSPPVNKRCRQQLQGKEKHISVKDRDKVSGNEQYLEKQKENEGMVSPLHAVSGDFK